MGTPAPTAPSAPQSLGASAGTNQVALSWSAPSSNGGSSLTTYTVYRSTTSGVLGSALSPGPGLSTSYTDTTAANGSTYYYLVKASNAVGESLSSNEAPATPSAPATAAGPLAPAMLPAVARGERRHQPGLPLVERSQFERRLLAHDLHRVSLHDLGCPRKRALARPRPVHELHGHDGRERLHLLLPREGEQRGRRVALLERGLGDAERACNGPLGSAVARGERRHQPGLPLLERSQLERRLLAHDLHRVSLHDLGCPRKRALARPRPVHELHGHDGRERLHLLLPGEGEQRGRRVALLDEASATPSAPATAPSAPQSLGASAGNNQVSTLRGALPARTAAPRSRPTPLYRSTTSGVLGSALSPGPGLSTSYTDTTAANGTTYYYLVKASNAVGESLSSNEAPATPSAPATAPSAPQSLGASAGNNQVSLSWSRSQLERRLRAHDLHPCTAPRPRASSEARSRPAPACPRVTRTRRPRTAPPTTTW